MAIFYQLNNNCNVSMTLMVFYLNFEISKY